ncbi:hypothetical protein SCP_0312100 [Sparassis crispa]|uniref:Uncharacterized protein n=1 Tax=Sparassis crispa TaxID=139825 RepID=A0A401GH87_9APHY|nr:hypothetical protein SCP_0312100 [Sparassis crispa]GBE81481.1 hypothetical protein SCP_0312100 [Sparassis crispa]
MIKSKIPVSRIMRSMTVPKGTISRSPSKDTTRTRIPTNATVQAAAATSPVSSPAAQLANNVAAQVLLIMNQTPNTSSTFIPISMPRPGGKGTPSFNGKHVQDFISDFESAAKAAGIANTEWPKLVLRYCDSKVHRIIENDAAFAGTVWADARAQLTYYYESSDHKPKVPPRRLHAFVKC